MSMDPRQEREVDDSSADPVPMSQLGWFQTNWTEKYDTFESMGIDDNLLRGVYSYGWEQPSTIQQMSIVPIIRGHDTIGQSQAGTGKTGTFAIAALQRVDLNISSCQVLILAPTRELAQQTKNVSDGLGHFMGVTVHACVGGTNVRNDIYALTNGVQVVSGTPGRVTHMIGDGYLDVTKLKLLILDEADVMMSKGFKEQVQEIFSFLPRDVQVALFSATMPPDVLELTRVFMRDPVRVLMKKEALTLDTIKQYYVAVEKEQYKLATLFDLYEVLTIQQAVIFCNSRAKVEWLSDQMTANEFAVTSIHGAMTPQNRELIMKEFVSGSTRVLIATNLLARGIDVSNVSLVINFDLPTDRENYIHRIGRAGRYGRKGVAINFVTDDEEHVLRELQSFYDTQITELPQDTSNVMP